MPNIPEQAPFSKFHDAGYRRLVPIIPPGAAISEHSSLARRPSSVGKAPGIKGQDGLWRGYDWLRAPDASPADLDAWTAMGAGIGIRTGGGLVGFDIDTLDQALADKIEAMAREALGSAPVRYGNAPKRLLLYRVTDQTPYQRVIFDDGLQHKPGAEARVELLSDDRQFVAWGTHPTTRQPYRWVDAVPYDDLTLVTPDQISALFGWLTVMLPAAQLREQGASADRANIDQASLRGAPEDVAAAVAALPNTFPDREDYIRVGIAIKAALQDDPATGLELYQQWAAKWEGDNAPDIVDADWGRMKPPFKVGAQYLYQLAEQHSDGAFRRAETWFDEVATAPDDPFLTAEQHERAKTTMGIAWLDPYSWEGVDPPEREWEVEGWIPRREVCLLYGDGGVGKSLLIHQYATAAAAGKDWLGQPTRPARVMAFFCEDGEDELHRRQKNICRAMGISLADIKGRVHISSRKYMDNLLATWDRNSGVMKRTAVWDQLRTDAKAFGATVIIIDTLADTFGGSEIDRSQVNAFVKSCLGRLAQEIDGTLIALGHPSVAGKAEGRSGSTAWSNAARSRIFLRYPKGVEKGDVRELEGMKLNYGPKGSLLKLKWDRGAFSVLAASHAGIDGEAVAGTLPTVEDLTERAVLAALAEAEIAGVALNLSKRSSAYAPKVLKRQWPEYLAGYDIEAVESAVVSLEKRGVIRAATVGRRRENRMPIQGYALAKTWQDGATSSGMELDKLSEVVGGTSGVFT